MQPNARNTSKGTLTNKPRVVFLPALWFLTICVHLPRNFCEYTPFLGSGEDSSSLCNHSFKRYVAQPGGQWFRLHELRSSDARGDLFAAIACSFLSVSLVSVLQAIWKT
eukprot:6484462-Amphidinium_carterae.1